MSDSPMRIATKLFSELAATRNYLKALLKARLVESGVSVDSYLVLSAARGATQAWSSQQASQFTGIELGKLHRIVKALTSESLLESVPGTSRTLLWTVSATGRSWIDSLRVFDGDSALNIAIDRAGFDAPRSLGDELRWLNDALREGSAAGPITEGVDVVSDRRTAVDRLCSYIFATYNIIRIEQTQYLAEMSGGTIGTAHYMAMLCCLEQTSLGDLARFMRSDEDTAQRVVAHLERLGYARRMREGGEPMVQSTPAARDFVTSSPPFDPDGRFSRMIASGSGQAAALTSTMTRLAEGLSGSAGYYESFDSVLESMRPGKLDGGPARRTSASREYRRAMGSFATGVAILTAGGAGRERGMTVNSLTSVSLSPPILLVCLIRELAMLGLVTDEGQFGLNILSDGQSPLSNQFGRSDEDGSSHQLTGNSWTRTAAGVPILRDAVASFVCRVDSMIDVGDHTIILGAPISVEVDENSRGPLVFWRGGYQSASSQSASSAQ